MACRITGSDKIILRASRAYSAVIDSVGVHWLYVTGHNSPHSVDYSIVTYMARNNLKQETGLSDGAKIYLVRCVPALRLLSTQRRMLLIGRIFHPSNHFLFKDCRYSVPTSYWIHRVSVRLDP